MNANIRTIGGAAGAAVMSSVVTAGARHGVPKLSGYTHGFAMLTIATIIAAIAATFVPKTVGSRSTSAAEVQFRHAELGMVAGGTLVGDESE
jgi:hypothetical protein